jgi:DedD protein
MASPASTETIEIRRRGRRRLIGAIAIVVLLVVFVPMLLDSEPQRAAHEPSTQIPPRDNAPPLPAPGPAPAKPAAEAPKVAQVTPAPAATAAKPVEKAAPAPRLQGFAVQVGAFRDEETLRQARAKLAAAGVAHYTERLEGDAGLTRLRAGPFPTREAAEGARATLKRASIEGQVVPLP